MPNKVNIMPTYELHSQFDFQKYCNPEDESLTIAIVIDSGSGSIKLAAAHIDETGHAMDPVFSGQLNMSLSADLETNIAKKSKELGEMVKSAQLLEENSFAFNEKGEPINFCEIFNTDLDSGTYAPSNMSTPMAKVFSDAMKQDYLHRITEQVKAISHNFLNHPVEVWLVGTAALRKADDGINLVHALENKIQDELHMDTNFRILSQDDEGEYGFISATIKTNSDQDNSIVWDIGGGSMQITGKNLDESFTVLGGTVASATFLKMAMDFKHTTDIKDLYPASTKDINSLINLCKDSLKFNEEKETWLKNKIGSDTAIIGAGNIHSSVLKMMKVFLKKESDGYALDDINNLLHFFSNKPLSEILTIAEKDGGVTFAKFADKFMTNVVILKAAMEKYKLNYIKVADTSNTTALLSKAGKKIKNK